MSQASPQLQQFVDRLWDWLVPFLRSPILKQVNQWLEEFKGWLGGLAILLLLLIWNWQLVASVGVGLGALVLVYLTQQGQWQLPKLSWHKVWSRSNRPLSLAIVAGLIVCFGTYLTIAIWIESGGSWQAKGMILQGVGILTILVLLGWQALERYQGDRDETHPHLNQVNQLLADLSAADPLKRLIAVRCITRWTIDASSSDDRPFPLPMSTLHLTDCFRLMLNRETDPTVCRALLESLKTLKQQQLQPGQPPLSYSPTLQAMKLEQD